MKSSQLAFIVPQRLQKQSESTLPTLRTNHKSTQSLVKPPKKKLTQQPKLRRGEQTTGRRQHQTHRQKGWRIGGRSMDDRSNEKRRRKFRPDDLRRLRRKTPEKLRPNQSDRRRRSWRTVRWPAEERRLGGEGCRTKEEKNKKEILFFPLAHLPRMYFIYIFYIKWKVIMDIYIYLN